MSRKDRFAELFTRTAAGIKPGLATITALLKCLGDPQNSFAAIHIAGTNGKGSVAAMLEAILRAAGFKTGLYTSPHLVEFNERIKIAGLPVEDEPLADSMDRVQKADAKQVAAGGRQATFFEMATAMAFDCFRESAIHIAVIETGMGGRWDATNVINPLLSVITPISLEHENYLGSDILRIASEKSGIIKEGVPVVIADQEEPIADLLWRTAQEHNSILKKAGELVSINRVDANLDGQKLKIEGQTQSYPLLRCPLPGRYQIGNCAIAIAAAETVFEIFKTPLPADVVKMGLENVCWPGRGQVIKEDPVVVLDGAHNPAAARELKQFLKEIAGKHKLGMVLGFLKDKDVRAFMNHFAGWLDSAWIVQIENPRALDARSIEDAVAPLARHCHGGSGLESAYREALAWAQKEDGIVCITGSLYLIGEFLEKCGDKCNSSE